ncbi:UNVERIFIED_CONTAM: hypothetical protein Sangu_2449900 [Sesamum angustifolium]|uniref:Uncharacterized protein n=1 Tax=Sesamum angustifolium TaxID=2727405 RepID=A0AAW2KX60_9LAMI
MQNFFNCYATSWLSKTFSKARVGGKQPNWLRDDIRHDLQVYWDIDEFKTNSAKNKANLVANLAATSIVYRGGFSSMGMPQIFPEVQSTTDA